MPMGTDGESIRVFLVSPSFIITFTITFFVYVFAFKRPHYIQSSYALWWSASMAQADLFTTRAHTFPVFCGRT